MGLIMMFLVNLASSQGAPNTGILLPQPTAPEYIQCAPLTEDKAFQTTFRRESVLLPFLNDLLRDTLPSELTRIELQADDQQMFVPGRYGTKHDIYARDDMDNTYVVEMERICEIHDIVRFQYVSGKVFGKVIDSRYNTLRNISWWDAALKTQNAKNEAARKAEAKAKKEGATSAEVDAAKKVAVKGVKTVTPRAIGPDDLFNATEVPTVLIIVIVENGMPGDHINSRFTKEEQYVLMSSYDELGMLSKKNFTYVDLKRFASTQLLKNPKTPLDHWCLLLWNSRAKRIEKKEVEKLRKFPGISEALDEISNMQTQYMLELEWQANKDETLRSEGRSEGRLEGRLEVVRGLLKKKMPDADIMEVSGISEDELKELKSSSP